MIKDAIRRAAAREEVEDRHGRDGTGPNKRPRDDHSDVDGDHEDIINKDIINRDSSIESSREENDSGSDSSSDSSNDDFNGMMSLKLLPRGVPTWVITDPVIPDQFSLNDYTKSYSLKSYDMTRSLQKELKKL